MEESGHYYTVYFISLAVGFRNDIARQHAFFTQMPDEVDQLDAYTLHVRYALAFPTGATLSIQRYLNHWRILVEHNLHALTGGDAGLEQRRTRDLLRNTDVTDFMKFGFLLHRYGDTYAHVQKAHPDRMYFADPNVSFYPRSIRNGHACDGTSPDHPWEREVDGTMRRYLSDLFSLFSELAARPVNAVHLRSGPRVAEPDIHTTFQAATRAALRWQPQHDQFCRWYLPDVSNLCEYSEEAGPQRYFIDTLRRTIRILIGESFDDYQPESAANEVMSWQQFRDRYGDRLQTFGQGSRPYTAADYRETIQRISLQLASSQVQ